MNKLSKERSYIEVRYEENQYSETLLDMGIPIRYIGERPNNYGTFQYLAELYEIETGEELTLENALNNSFTMSEEEEIFEEFISFYPDYKSTLHSFEEASEELTDELFEFSINSVDEIQKIVNGNDFQIGTVGRSDWTYYIMHKKHKNYNLPFDVWEGYNFYTISLLDTDPNGRFLGYKDSIHFVYAPNTEDIFEAISDHFGLNRKDIYLINNEITQHILNINKLNKRTETYYEPITQ